MTLLASHEKQELLKNSHLITKVFTNVQNFEITEKGDIVGVESLHGERFALSVPVNPEGNSLVKFLNKLKHSLGEAVRQEGIKAVQKVPSAKVEEVIDDFSFQGLLFATKVQFTQDGEEALEKRKLKDLKNKLVDKNAYLAK